MLEASGIQWLALSHEERLNVTAQVLKQIPVLWIWDNVEPINGFPTGSKSAWSEDEQRSLKSFLRNMGDMTKAKFLLTSRRDERAWLGELPARVGLPPMPMQERVQLARALADKLGAKMSVVEDWKPLLNFTRGNPLTITVVVGQALRDGIETRAQIKVYLEKLRKGQKVFKDETSEGRSKSLGASLSYGFESAFSEEERKILALLHFFQGFVNTDPLRWMLTNENWGLGYKNYDNEKCIALLNKAADIGLVTTVGSGYYTIHPALPWFFRALFEQYYPDKTEDGGQQTDEKTVISPPSSVARRAYVEAMGQLGDYYHNQYGAGNRDVIAPLRAEEANLLHARYLAMSGLRKSKGNYDWSDPLTSSMQGLRVLYDHTGRRAEWKRLVEQIVPDFVGADDLPLPGREEQWGLVTEYCVRLVREERDWPEAERLQHKRVEWERLEAAHLLARPPEGLNAGEKNTLRTLAVSIEQLGHIQREQGKPECAETYKDSIPLYQKVQATANEAIAAFNLGHAYKDLPALRDLDEAERWYQRGLDLLPTNDLLNKGKGLGTLGNVVYERFKDAKKDGKTEDEFLQHLNSAVDYYQQALALLPPDAVDDLAVTHSMLGSIFGDANNLDRAVSHYGEAAKLLEQAGNFYNAGVTRRNMAIDLANNGRLSDALLYARAALRNFESYGGRAGDQEEKARGLIAMIEQAIEESKK